MRKILNQKFEKHIKLYTVTVKYIVNFYELKEIIEEIILMQNILFIENYGEDKMQYLSLQKFMSSHFLCSFLCSSIAN